MSHSAQPFVVVELFSSEGCSSCPPADQLLAEIVDQAKTTQQRIFALSFQVDYWNYLGWKDPFSRPEFTRRQQGYAKTFRETSVYTPQMIVNGTHVFVGSDRRKALAAINEQLQVSNPHEIQLKSLSLQDGQWNVEYKCSVVPQTNLNFALVAAYSRSDVTAGENARQSLTHVNIVRLFQTILPQSHGRMVFNVSQFNESGSYSLIAFLQEKNQGKILAAQSIILE